MPNITAAELHALRDAAVAQQSSSGGSNRGSAPAGYTSSTAGKTKVLDPDSSAYAANVKDKYKETQQPWYIVQEESAKNADTSAHAQKEKDSYVTGNILYHQWEQQQKNLKADSSAHAQAEKDDEAEKNPLFHQWKTAFDRQQEQKAAANEYKINKLQKELDELDRNASYSPTTAASEEYQNRRKEIVDEMISLGGDGKGSGEKVGSNIKLVIDQGLTQADHRIAQTADWLFGGIAKEGKALVNSTLQTINPEWGFKDEDPWITRHNKKGAQVLTANEQEAQRRVSENELNTTVWKYAPQVVAAIPDAVLAMITGGASKGAQATTKALEAASTIAQGSKAYQTVKPIANVVENMITSPAWASAFAQSAGSSYENALAEGASEEQASLYAMVNGMANATIEVGGGDEALGGIQKLPTWVQDAIRRGDSNLIAQWAKSIVNEAGEEVAQGIAEKGFRGIYSDVPLVSTEDENAVINPNRMKEEAIGGAVVSAFLGGGQTAIQAVANSNVNSTYASNQSNVESEAPTAPTVASQATGDISTPPTVQNVKQGGSGALNPVANPDVANAQTVASVETQNNTASTQETAENTIMQESDLPDYMATGVRQHVRNAKDAQLKNGGSPILTTIEQIKGFIRSSLRGETVDTIKGYGKVGSRMAQDISDSSDGKTDVRGYYLELDGNRIRHMKDHVDVDSDGRNVPLTSVQAEQLTEYIDNYDEVLDVLTRKDGSTKVYLSKDTGDGHVVIVELVSKGRQSLQPVTAWQNTYEAFENIWGKKKEVDSASQDGQTPISRGYQPTSDSGATSQVNPQRNELPGVINEATSGSYTTSLDGARRLPNDGSIPGGVSSEVSDDISSDTSIPTDTQNVNENIKNADDWKALADKVSQNTDDAMTAEDVEISQSWASEPSAEDALRLKREGASGVEIYDKTGLFIDVDGNVRMPGTGDIVARETGTKEVQNVAHADRNLFTKGERISVNEKLGEKGANTHVRQSDELTVNEARRLIKDRGAEYETARLLSMEVDGSDKKGGFGNLEVCELELLLRDKVQEARKYMLTSPAKLGKSEFAEIISQLSDIEGKIQEVKTDAAQKLRQVGGAITPTEAITARAMKTFLNNGNGNINPKSKSAKRLRDIMGHLESIDAISDGDIGAMVSEIGKLSEQRGTNKVLGGKGQKAIDTLLDYRANQDGGFEWLKTLAYAQTDALITDAHSGFRGSPLECLKTLRVSNLLSNPSTWLNNFGNNTAALFWNARGQNAGRWADIGLSKFTGTQTLAKDSSFSPSKAQAEAITTAAAEATLNVLFDVNVDGTLSDSGKGRTKYESTGANYFKMSGGTIERILAQYEMLIRETLVMPDEVAKAQVKTGLDANRTQAVEDGKITRKAWAELMGDSTHEARYRTLQSDTEMTWAVQQFKNFFNKAHISDSKGGSIGLGDMVAVFAKVPTNVVTQKIQNSPIGWGMSFVQYVNAVKDAKNGKLSATEQAKVSRAVGRTLNGFTMTALSAICAGLGIVKRFDDDDADKAAIDKSRGMSGLQWNISALFRLLAGQGIGGEWHDDDICIGGDWLEILSLPSALGVEMYQDYVDGASWTELPGLALAFTAENVKDTLFSLPGLSTLENIYNNINYGNSGWESVLTSAADVLGSMLAPNAAYQFAAGADNTVRDIYNTDSAWETAANILKQREYFLRKTIAPKVNALGEEQKYGDSTVMGILNKVLLPGDVRQYTHGEYEDVIDMLINAGENVRYPSKSAPDTITVGEGKDKQEFVLTADEKRQYLKISGVTTKELVGGMSGYDFYDTLDASTKNDIVSELTSYAKSAAKQAIIEGRLGDNADLLDTGAASWMNNVPEETAGKYIFAKNTIKQMYDDGKLTDYAGMDDYLGNRLIGYMQLGNAGREALNNAFPRIDDMYTAYRAGISSKQWSETYEKYKEISNSPKEGYGTTDKTTDFSAWVDSRSSLSSQQKELLKEQFKFYSHIQGEASLYNKLTGVGYEPEEANDLYWRLDGMSTDGNNNVSQKEAYARLSSMDDISDEEKNVLWSVINAGWKTSYTEYKKKHS